MSYHCHTPGCGFSGESWEDMQEHLLAEHPARMSAGLDRLLRGAVGVGDQTPRDMPLSPFEAETLAEAVENATMWLHDAWQEIPAADVAEQEDRNERMAHLQLLRARLLALHFGKEVPL